MLRLFILLCLLLVNSSLFAQKFMLGFSVSPNISWSNSKHGYFVNNNYYYTQPFTTYSSLMSESKLAPGVAFGAGVNLGIYVGNRFFLLTGLEKTAMTYYSKVNTLIYYSRYAANGNLNVKNNNYSWELPLLGNFLLGDKSQKVSFFLTAGFMAGANTLQIVNSKDPDARTIAVSSSQLSAKYYLDAVLGAGWKFNLNQKVSLLLMPDFKFKLTNTSTQTLNTLLLRTGLMYNF